VESEPCESWEPSRGLSQLLAIGRHAAVGDLTPRNAMTALCSSIWMAANLLSRFRVAK
jgi:hypothetical protein